MTVDLSAIAKWPNVPACYGWLSLDRRGDWRLQGERVSHRGLTDFINRQYGCDESGRWFLQNGPQRVFVELACTPWVFRREGDGFISHTGQAAGTVKSIYLDEEGNVLFETELGIGLLDDRDLTPFLAACIDAHGEEAEESAFAALMAGYESEIYWSAIQLQSIRASEIHLRFRFDPHPSP